MKKIRTYIKGCPLFAGIIVSAVLLSAAGYIGAAAGIYKFNVSLNSPMLETVLLDERSATSTDAGVQTAEVSETAAAENTKDKAEDSKELVGADTAADAEKSAGAEAAENTEATGDAEEEQSVQAVIGSGGAAVQISRPTEYVEVELRKSRSSCYDDVTQIAQETDYPYIKVDKSYFDDALFIGDSRIEGLKLYSNLDNADYACMEGLTAFGLMTEKIAANGTMTLTELLSDRTYSKIYIMLGINEAGYDTDSYVSTYMEDIDAIRRLQPDAVIFMMGCLHVSAEYSNAHSVMNNDNIDQKNNGIASYADGISLFYLDVNSAVDDENGGLTKEYTWDDVHLQAQYYSLWENYLCERGLNESMFE